MANMIRPHISMYSYPPCDQPKPLGHKTWNVMTANDGRLPEFQSYVQQADAQGVRVLVSFEHIRGDATRCNQRKNKGNRQTEQRRLHGVSSWTSPARAVNPPPPRRSSPYIEASMAKSQQAKVTA